MGLAHPQLREETEKMLSDTSREQLTRQLATMRIIAGALCAGVLIFTGIVLVLEQGAAEEPVLAFVAILVSVGAVLAAVWVPRMIGAPARVAPADAPAGERNSALPESDQTQRVSQALARYQTRLIVSLAMLEGAAFLNLVAYMVEGQMVNVAVALVLWLLMLLQFPSRARTENWIAGQLRAANVPD
jgi:hypothetical protein